MKRGSASNEHRGSEHHSSTSASSADRPVTSAISRYETFTIRFLLDADGTIRRTEVTHVRRGTTTAWTEHDPTRLDQWMQQQLVADQPADGSAMPHSLEQSAFAHAQAAPTKLTGIARLGDLKVVPFGEDSPQGVIRHNQPFRIGVTLDLRAVTVPRRTVLVYRATVYARSLQRSSYQIVGVTSGRISVSDHVGLNVTGLRMLPGVYRLDVAVSLALPSQSLDEGTDMLALIEGQLLQVY